MKSYRICLIFALAIALLPASLAFGQSRTADIEDAKQLTEENPTFNNRLRLSTLQYLEGVDYMRAGDMENAIDMMQAGVWSLEDGAGLIAETHPVFEEARYGLSYALLQNENPYEALLVLEQLIDSSPTFAKARFLLGATLMNIPGEKSQQRGMEVFRQLALEGRSPYKEMGERAAIRFAYNLSTVPHATGNPEAATTLLTSITGAIGDDKGATGDEDNKIKYARGAYLRDSGDAMGAISEFEPLYESASDFQLDNGVALSGVLSNTYYQAGLSQLELGGASAAQLAAELFDSAAQVGDASALDVRHGKAIAYTVAGESDKAMSEIKAIAEQDPSYYNRIKK